MKQAIGVFCGLGLLFTLASATPATAQAPAAQAAPDGADLYKRSCAQCHDNGVGRAPNREQFRAMLPDRVLSAMESGSMVTMANGRSAVERRAIDIFVGECEGHCRSRGDAARQGLRGHRREYNRRLMPVRSQ